MARILQSDFKQQHLVKPFLKVATLKEANYLSTRLRQEDIDECKANANVSPKEALLIGVQHSHLPFTVYNKEHNPVMIMGVIPQGKNLGMIWLLSSPEIKNMPLTFLRNCKTVLDCYNQTFPVLYNYIDARNKLHINWLKWLGFRFIKVHNKFGYEQRKFIEFVKI